MKLSSIFNLVTNGNDVLDLFDGVSNVDQLRGRLRRLSQIEGEDLLDCLEGLRSSIAGLLNDTLEISPDLENTDDLGDSESEETPVDRELDELSSEGKENQSSESPTPTEKIDS